MKRKMISVLLAGIMLIPLSGCEQNTFEGKAVKSIQVSEDTYDVKMSYQGIVKSKETKNYSFMTGGKVAQIFVTEGQQIKKGDKLAQLDTVELKSNATQSENNEVIANNNLNKTEASYLTNISDAEINIKSLQSNISAYKKTVEVAEEGVAVYENSIPIATQGVEALEETVNAYQAKLESTKSAVDLAGTNLERMKSLYEAGAVSKSEVENMQVQYDDALASYEQAEAQQSTNQVNLSAKRNELDSMNAQLEAKKAEAASAQAQLLNMQNQLDSANKNLANLKKAMQSDISSQKASDKISQLAQEQAERAVKNATLTADNDGYVMKINIKQGEMTGAGTPAVTVKSQMQVVTVGVSIEDFAKLDNVQKILLNGEIEGKIDSISQYPDEATRTYAVDITFDNEKISMGELVDVDIVTSKSKGVFIPIDSIVNMDGIDYVYKINEDDTVSRIEVKCGEIKDNTVLVENLTNERIVVSGMRGLNDNDKIKESGDADDK